MQPSYLSSFGTFTKSASACVSSQVQTRAFLYSNVITTQLWNHQIENQTIKLKLSLL